MNEPTTVAELRDALFGAILCHDDEALTALCNDYAGAIVEHFDEWKKVPEAIRGDPNAMQAWARCLMTLASSFERAGIPDLMERLTGGANNPILGWQRAMARAKALADAGDYAASTEELARIRPELDGASGSVVSDYRPKLYGLLGTNAFHLGHADDALEFTTRALDECRAAGDATGVRAYTENLRVLTVAAAAGSDDEESVRVRAIRAALARAQDLSDDARFDRSNDVLKTALREIEAAAGGPGAEYASKAYGLLGLNACRLGEVDAARAHTRKALEACRAHADADGVRIYTANLAYLDAAPRQHG